MHIGILLDISKTVISVACNSFMHVSKIYDPHETIFISSCTCSCDSHRLRFLPRNVVKFTGFNDFCQVEQSRRKGSLLYSKKK